MTAILHFADISPDDLPRVGGKALSLARMLAAGLPVPPGFCLTAEARLPDAADALLSAFRALGGPVAVRSSATDEDGSALSFAGQQATVLNVTSESELLAAVERCRASLAGERAIAYRRAQGQGDAKGMGVVVQRMVDADAAGVLFTRDPLDPDGRRMLAEAALGLGEAVVSGHVTPDRFTLDRETGDVIETRLSGEEPCLALGQLRQLWEMGRRAEALYGEARDLEFAFAGGKCLLLQARPITAAGAADVRAVREEEKAALRSMAEKRGTVWARFNLAEVLPAPTPMTWEVVQSLLCGEGGFGLMARDLGFRPAPELARRGAFDLIGGRPYCNLGREPRLLYADVPFAHDFRVIKADPRKAFYPVPALRYGRFPWWFWAAAPVTWPWLMARLAAGGRRQLRLLRTFPRFYRDEIAPEFREEVRAAPDPASLEDAALLRFLTHWRGRTLVTFARDSLKPTALAALALGEFERKFAQVMPAAKAADLARRLSGGRRPPEEADLAGGVRALATGRLGREAFLARFGHRAGEEMELSRPRWGEAPDSLAHVRGEASAEPPSPDERLALESSLSAEQRALLLPDVALLHEMIGLRESAKNDLLRGYALIRAALVEIDRRCALRGGVFYLTPDELPRALAGEDFGDLIVKRRRRRALALGLDVPSVLFSDDLDAIDRPPETIAGALEGTPLSSGVAEGPALVLESPRPAAGVPEGYVLVCPTTDPDWVPLFVGAKALVMETGGVLSHGAIVARELGLPAVAGLPGVVRRLRTGQRLRVDGGRGTVAVLDVSDRGTGDGPRR